MIITKNLMFETIAVKGNIGYASAYEMNGLYEVNIATGECLFIDNFDECITWMRLHSKAIRIKDEIYFIPGSGRNISVFDVKNKTLRSIPVPEASTEKYKFYKPNMKFIDAIHHGNDLWLIPSTYPGILRLNLNTEETEVYDSWIPADGYMFRSKMCVEGNSIIIPDGISNLVFKFNLKNQSSQLYRVGKLNKGVMCMKKIGACYYMAPRAEGTIIAWNPSLDNAMEYVGYPSTFVPGNCVFSDIYSSGGKIYFVPMEANESIVLDGDKLLKDRSNWRGCTKPSSIYKSFETNTHIYYQEYRWFEYRRTFKISISDRTVSDVDFFVVNNEEANRSAFEKAAATREVLYDDGFYRPSDLLSILV